ncbi:uncharacterized protein BT62DRAFT_910654, partial [Guyanagaster necrorhizus]
LKAFHSAITEILTTTKLILLMTHAVFWDLQDGVKRIIATPPPIMPPELKMGLLDAYCKLSGYYKYDKSPFYI